MLWYFLSSSFFPAICQAQKWYEKLVVKTNGPTLLLGGVNTAAEYVVNPKTSLVFPLSYSGWDWPGNEQRKMRHFLFQPAVRWWRGRAFRGWFTGIDANVGIFNVGSIPLFYLPDSFKKLRSQGNLYGAGVETGFQSILDDHFSLEACVGAGYAYLDYEKFHPGKGGYSLGRAAAHYLGPTKLVFSLVYLIR